jgi:hypothetical protein
MGELAWSILAVLVVASALAGWAMSGAIQRQWRQERTDERPALMSPTAWGEPDLAPPSLTPEALAEVAELEATWRQAGHRRRASSD